MVAGLCLTGCPLPQPIAEVAHEDGSTATTPPPRIVVDSVVPAQAVIAVQRDCSPPAQFTLRATVHDDDPLEHVDARWFVDYAGDPFHSTPYSVQNLDPPDDPNQVDRPLTPVPLPLEPGDPAPFHLVELVVSNGFYALFDPAAPVPNRSAQPGFETQVFRWVFQYVETGGVCRCDAAGVCE